MQEKANNENLFHSIDSDDTLLRLHAERCIEVLTSEKDLPKQELLEKYITTRQITLLADDYQQAIAANNRLLNDAMVHHDYVGIEASARTMHDLLHSPEALRVREQAAEDLFASINQIDSTYAEQFLVYVDVPLESTAQSYEYRRPSIVAAVGEYATRLLVGLGSLRLRYFK